MLILKNILFKQANLLLVIEAGKEACEEISFRFVKNGSTEEIREVSANFIEQDERNIYLRINFIIGLNEQKIELFSEGLWSLEARNLSGEKIEIIQDCSDLQAENTEIPQGIIALRKEQERELADFNFLASKLYYHNRSDFLDVRMLANKNSLALLIGNEKSKGYSFKKREKKWHEALKHPRKIFVRIAMKLIFMQFLVWQKLCKVKRQKVLFTSDSRTKIGGNEQFVYEQLQRHHEVKSAFVYPRKIKSPFSFRYLFVLPFELATSKVIVVDDYQQAIFEVPYRKEQEIVQLWHATGAFKTFGFSRLGKAHGPSLHSKGNRVYTHAFVSSDFVKPFYAEAFGILENKVISLGVARDDDFFDELRLQAQKEKVQKEIPAINGKRVVLIAPTFRGDLTTEVYYPTESVLNFEQLYEYGEANNTIFLLKLHPYIAEKPIIPAPFNERVIDCSNYREVNDLLVVADLLVTDYSSVVFNYATFERPMIFYAYDLEEYVSERDFYVNFEDFTPGEIVRNMDELLRALSVSEMNLVKVREFKNKYYEHQDNEASKRIAEFVLELTRA
ncbi:CDP-glycerol glycerophosphotransferase, TagB/SpsB family [Pilibacter termitis]|uniref:CDP-glycerol glycerophosphotransferase, TagB/SpsB family n=1 Tax=Pilibacter termitis TaxID=263852 RepID=A0A1T4P951_9ENTE|nr:CDP-glycerol glycerophosphotransferase family protein [Pilibacter termitis]SJZ87989.1 CDP-glycerol glycerophosphotransferase, TagB/SpsB family [Pilibacter termitis]